MSADKAWEIEFMGWKWWLHKIWERLTCVDVHCSECGIDLKFRIRRWHPAASNSICDGCFYANLDLTQRGWWIE